MTAARWVTIGVVVLALVACGADDGSVASDATIDATTTDAPRVDLAAGAFERNEGTKTGEAGAAEVVGTTVLVPGTDAVTDPTAPDTATTTPSTVPTTVETNPSSTTAPTTPGVTTATTPGSGTSPPAAPGPMQGLVQIGDVLYPFDAESCEFDVGLFEVVGYGVSSAGDPVEVTILFESIDLDGDGVDELSLDLYVDPDVATGVDLAGLPEFYASKAQDGDIKEGADLTVTLDGARITGAGPITDYNGVASPLDQPLPMTFEARCS